MQAGLANLVEKKKQELAGSIIKIEELRGCGAEKTKPGCNVSYRFIAQGSRNASRNDVFVQTAIAAALVRSEPMVVAFNYVQAEDAAIPRADYSEQMRIVAYLAGSPAGEKRVNVSLHADQLRSTLTALEGTLKASERTMRIYGDSTSGPTAELTKTMAAFRQLSARLDSTLANPRLPAPCLRHAHQQPRRHDRPAHYHRRAARHLAGRR